MLSIIDSEYVSNEKFSAEKKFVSLSDNRGLIICLVSICYSIFKECMSRLQRVNNPLVDNAKNLFPILQKDGAYLKDLQPWINGNDSSQLIVLIHGLNSSPLCWSKYIQKLAECKKSTSYFAPYVYKKGYCKVREAAQPIFDVIQKYVDQYPDNPITLVGHSNGARIALYLDIKLEAKNITLVSIAGPHLGSKLVNWTTYLNLNSWLGISDSMARELLYDSGWVNEKLIKWQKKCIEHVDRVRKRIFIASVDDFRVFPNTTSFPNLPNSTYLLISGESHVTIVDAACDTSLKEAL